MRGWVSVFAICLVVGCSTASEQQDDGGGEVVDEADEQEGLLEDGGDTETEDRAAHDEPTQATIELAPMWQQEGLDRQDRMTQLAQDGDRSPGTTEWRESSYEVPGELGNAEDASAPTPGALLVQLVGALNLGAGVGSDVWEQTIRVQHQGDDQATGVVLQWGIKDDSVAGSDLRVHIRRGERGWYVESLEQRAHCARGVSEEGLCQ